MKWNIEKIQKYAPHFSENKLWKKLGKMAKKARVHTIYAVLLCYYVLNSPNVSTQDKAIIWGALGYFIFPLDLIPDAIPVVGFTDDLAALVYALRTIWVNVTPEIKQQAHEKLKMWFKDIDTDSIELF